MAEERFVTRKDLEGVTQKVAIQNAKDVAKPLVDQQKNNDLKELERSIEQKALFQDIADGIRGVGDSLLNGLKSLIPKTDGGLSKLLGLGLGLLLAPFAAFIGFIGQLGVELRFFNKLVGGRLSAFFKPIKDFFTKNKFIQKVVTAFRNIFSGKGGFFTKLGNFFGSIKKFATGGPFKAIMKFAGSIGRIMGKVFLPITILMGIFDFVKGFMRGYKEGGIVEGIKQGVMDLVDGLIGNLIRILMWIPTKLAEWLGLDQLATAIGEYTDDIFAGISGIFSGLVDFLKGLFTWDTAAMSESLGKVWEGIKKVVLAPFNVIKALVADIFGGSAIERAKLALLSIGLSMQSFFMYLQQGILKLVDNALVKNIVGFFDEGMTKQIEAMSNSVDIAKKGIDADNRKIKAAAARLKQLEIDEQNNAERIRRANELKEKSQTNINTSNNSNSAVVNNINIINNNSSTISANALKAAIG